MMSLGNNSSKWLGKYNKKDVRDACLIFGILTGIMIFGATIYPIVSDISSKPIIDYVMKAKTCSDIVEVKASMTSTLIPDLPMFYSKELISKAQAKIHELCQPLLDLDKKYNDKIPDATQLTCQDLNILIQNVPSDILQDSYYKQYVKECIAH